MRTYRITEDLPDGPMLLEASAGTGKTWTITALATRYVAEAGVAISQVLLITFSNAAATELRGRLYARIHTVAEHLNQLLAGRDLPEADPVATHLVAEPKPRACLTRLRTALDEFGTATITTIHSFCQNQLASLGMLGDWDDDDQVMADVAPMVHQCATDEYLARYMDQADPPLDAKRALRVAAVAAPSSLPLVSANEPHLDYHLGVRRRFAERRRQLGMVSFDDLPGRLRHLTETSPATCAALRDRFPVVLVDEFQDTDPDQWAILKHAFVEGKAMITLIGDPKQSIYGFRSADLGCYLEATRLISNRATLGANYRSEPGVVRGVDELFGTVNLGPGIELVPVRPAYSPKQPRLVLEGAPRARVWLRGLRDGDVPNPAQAVMADMVAQVSALLAGGMIRDDQGERPIEPHDIAILTRTKDKGHAVVAALARAGLPAQWQPAPSALRSPALEDWLAVLGAVNQPTRGRIMDAALGDLLGVVATDVLAADDESSASRRVHELARRYAAGGLVLLVTDLLAGLPTRLGPYTDGARRLRDLQQLGELLLTCPATDLDGVSAWLADVAQHHDLGSRLASDASTVRVSTMHSAKGLEFPIVLLPQVSVTDVNLNGAIPYVDDSGQRVLYVGERPSRRDEVAMRAREQAREEELRLLYVGLTRAKHLAIAWHVMDIRAASGPLTALLCRDRDQPQLQPEYSRLPGRFPFDPALVALSSAVAPAWQPATPHPMVARSVPEAPTLSVTRPIDQAWRRTSYSGLTSDLHEYAPDEPDVDVTPDLPAGPAASPSPMNGLPAGARFGTLVHEILEAVDWGQPGAIHAATTSFAPSYGLDTQAAAQLAEALTGVVSTPLGGLFDGTLADLPVTSRLAELDFDLPLGDRGPAAVVADLAEVMRRHLPGDDPLAAYPDRLAATDAAAAPLTGFLTGSIDAVLQVPRGFVVVDYKTNRLPTPADQELAVGHYRASAMAEAMMQAHYPLQAILYCAALHRYLAWRLPGYSPDSHLAGVGYLFVRGMAGPDTPELDGGRCGVFEWYPPITCVLEISEVLGGACD